MPTFPNQIDLEGDPGSPAIRVLFYGQDQQVIRYVLAAVQHALRETRVWGKLRHRLIVRIFPTHRSLEEAVLQRYQWLRAWALFDEIYLQSPRTWNFRLYQSALSELLVHELTHVAMYQRCCLRKDWRFRWIPFWFREGMASVTADQGKRRWSMERLGHFYRSGIGRHVILHPGQHLQRYQPVAYSVAHWMFVYFVRQCKREGVRKLLDQMRQGKSFAQAFYQVSGMTLDQFRAFFEKELRAAYSLSAVGMLR